MPLNPLSVTKVTMIVNVLSHERIKMMVSFPPKTQTTSTLLPSSSRITKRVRCTFVAHHLACILLLPLVATSTSSMTPDDIQGQERELAVEGITCNEGEILLEIIVSTSGDDQDEEIEYDWQVIDDLTGEIVAACDAGNETESSNLCYWRPARQFHDQICLPSQGCYRLVTGEQSRYYHPYRWTTLSVFYGGEEIFDGKQYKCKSMLLKNSQSTSERCNKNACRGLELELFIFYRGGIVDPYWNFSGEIFVDQNWNSSRQDWIISDKDSGSEWRSSTYVPSTMHFGLC